MNLADWIGFIGVSILINSLLAQSFKKNFARQSRLHLAEFDWCRSCLHRFDINQVCSIYYFGRGVEIGLLNKLDSINPIQDKILND